MKRFFIGLFALIGPGLIIASVALGPGSVTAASTIGAEYGYSLIWVVILSVSAMMMYTAMAARFGATQEQTFLAAISASYGRWLSVLIGIAAFLMSASFQFGNNLGVSTAMSSITGFPEFKLDLLREDGSIRTVAGSMDQFWPFVFTGTALLLVLFARNLYKVVERLMTILVMVMIFAFFLNLVAAKPDLGEAARGLIPSLPEGDQVVKRLAAMVGTTFVLHACLYQSYLVQAKGWKLEDVRKGLRDSIVGITILGTISILIMMTSAAALRPEGLHVNSAADMAIQLEKLFGSYAQWIFCTGLWAAAFSSIPVNAIIGGGLLADGLGLGRNMNQGWPRFFAILIMITGMMIATFYRGSITDALILAQAATMLAMPAVAIGMFLILNNRKVMGVFVNNRWHNVGAVFGLGLVLVMSYATYSKLVEAVREASWAPEAIRVAAPAESEPEPEPGDVGLDD